MREVLGVVWTEEISWKNPSAISFLITRCAHPPHPFTMKITHIFGKKLNSTKKCPKISDSSSQPQSYSHSQQFLVWHSRTFSCKYMSINTVKYLPFVWLNDISFRSVQITTCRYTLFNGYITIYYMSASKYFVSLLLMDMEVVSCSFLLL